MILQAANDPSIPRDGSHTWVVLNEVETELYYVSWCPPLTKGNDNETKSVLIWWTEQNGQFMDYWCPTLDEAIEILAKMYDYGAQFVPVEIV